MATPYDEFAYPATTFRQTHPTRLSTLAALFGLPYAPVDCCRVLDIGCGDGVNIIAMAVTQPGSTFVGFDLAEAAIARGLEIVATLGLTNVRLETRDLTEADYGRGGFDYVIAHGLYSWVPAAARDALLASVRHHLAPNGVGFVSHNTLPGGRMRQVVREMVLFHIRGVEGVGARLGAARAQLARMLEFFAEQTPLHAQIRHECRHMLDRAPGALAHDELGEVFDPLYLHEFIAAAGRHGLQYLTEAGASRCGEGFRPPYALDDPAFDVLAHAQELDFQALRAYRENLVVHADVAIDRRPDPSRLFDLYVASPAIEAEPGVFDVRGRRFNAEEAHLTEVVRRIDAAWPQALPVSSLIDDVERAGVLLRMHWLELLDLQTAPWPITVTVGERPRVSPLTRLQAARGGPWLTTPSHATVEINDDRGLRFIAGLDGARTLDEIAADAAVSRAQVVEKLQELARLALLV